MEIKDLTGLSKPITRLIEVVSEGIGRVTEPYLIRKKAEAKAYEIKVISDALKNVAEKHNLPVVYDHGEVEVWQKPTDHTLELQNNSLDQRVENRLDYHERKRQKNIEAVTAIAATELISETNVPEEKPDQDWVSRFFKVAQDVSSEQMQELWGRILAGEIKTPGSFSLRTLEFVRNITKYEAEQIEHLGKYALDKTDSSFIPVKDKAWLKEKCQVLQMDHFKLSELGILYPTDLALSLFDDQSKEEEVFFHGDDVLIIKRGEIVGPIEMLAWKFTEVGHEILQLVPRPHDFEFLEHFSTFFLDQKAEVTIGKITNRSPGGRITYNIIRKMENSSTENSKDDEVS